MNEEHKGKGDRWEETPENEVSIIRHRAHEKRQDQLEKEIVDIKVIVQDLQRLADYYKVVGQSIRKDLDELDKSSHLVLNLVHGHLTQEQEYQLRRNNLILRLTLIAGAILIVLESIHFGVTGRMVSASFIRELFAL